MFVSTIRKDVGVCVECTELLKRAVSPNRTYAKDRGKEHRTCHIGSGDEDTQRS